MNESRIGRECLILFFLCLWLFFFGSWSLPVTDPTESNYALTAKEMLLSGEYISPRIYGVDWYDKPIMFYWELIAAFGIFGFSDTAARFFPAVFALAGIFLTYFFASRLYGTKRGFVAAAILLTSVEYWYIAHAIITDMTLFFAMSAALIAFYLGYREKKPKYYYISYAAAALAVLTKGPIGFLMPGFIILLFLLWQRDLAHLLRMHLAKGMALFFGVVSVWYLPMFVMHGWEFVETFFGVHNVLRATVSEHPSMNRWYYYIVVFIGGFMPWVVPMLVRGIRHLWQRKKLPVPGEPERFLLVWALAVPLVFQCFATKYVTYTFPYMMPIAILFAGYFVKHELIFRRMVLGCALVLPILMFSVAAPLCEENSGRQRADFMESFAGEDTCIASYKTRYSASLVYYSGREVFFLVDNQEERERRQPGGVSWNSLNVMPFMIMEELPEDRPILVFVGDGEEEHFKKMTGKEWEIVGEFYECKAYYHDINED